ncbi:hypothetical protein [Bacillus sp. FSL K6-3431]|uniref:hypothetical protein n=1 Tax=Bacillus sp. FSL K6-3431 TaxID=2921500 RepID=UPI0030FB79B4
MTWRLGFGISSIRIVGRGITIESYRFSKKDRSLDKKGTNKPLQIFALLYSLLLIVSQLTSPTGASFHDATNIGGTLSAAEVFNEAELESPLQENKGDQQKETSSDDQNRDEIVDNESEEQVLDKIVDNESEEQVLDKVVENDSAEQDRSVMEKNLDSTKSSEVQGGQDDSETKERSDPSSKLENQDDSQLDSGKGDVK